MKNFREYQHEALHGGRGYPGVYKALKENQSALLVLPTGCHAKGQMLLRADSSLVAVEDVLPGDQLMGVNGDPRTVMCLCRGEDWMFEILPADGAPWVVNGEHLLSLVRAGNDTSSGPPWFTEVTVEDWIKWPKRRKHVYKLFRSPVLTGNPVMTSFSVKPLDERQPYYGFTLDGDGRYLLDDYTVTHNTGKTLVFSEVVEACVNRGRRALILAHRKELIQQAAEKLVATTEVGHFDVGIEMAGERAGHHHRVVVGSVQTLRGARLDRLDVSEFGLLVVDEAHHCPSESYQSIITKFRESGVKILGVTATPDRLDGKGMGTIFQSVAYVYEILDAINDGWLVPIMGEVIYSADMDLSEVHTVAGDFNQGELAEVMEREPNVALVAKGIVEKAGDLPTLGFAVSVAQAQAIAETINMLRPGEARAVSGDDPLRDQTIADFRAGRFQYLMNCQLATEGVDIPRIACVAMARPTKSRAFYSQSCGRGTRLLGANIGESIANGKPFLKILDFVGASGKHSLVSCLDVLDGNTDAEVRKRAMTRAQRGPVNIQLVLDEVAAEIVAEQRKRALAEVSYRSVAMADPFSVLGTRPRSGRFGGRPATLAQIALLSRHRLPGAREQEKRLETGKTREVETYDYGQATELLNAIENRRRKKLCTVRMATQLMRHGLNPDCKFETGKWAMDELQSNGWRPTKAMLEHPDLKVIEKGK